MSLSNSSEAVKEAVKEYYGSTLKTSADLQTNACCTPSSAIPANIKACLKNIHTDVIAKYYGCGLTIPPDDLTGLKILDLGCGSGRDCYILSQLVGKSGYVCGVDMTPQQLDVAKNYQAHHAEKFGYSNVDFRHGVIEDLKAAGLEDEVFDVVISNCVVNLSSNKLAVLKEAFRVLKDGGEMYFSDVYSSRRIPSNLIDNPVLYGECLSGALYWNDFLSLAKRAGFTDPRLVEDSRITIKNPEIEALVGNTEFFSATYRLIKSVQQPFDADCEDYGQAVRYKGNCPNHPFQFVLDGHHVFETNRMSLVCRNSYLMLSATRLHKYFEFFGDESTHFGKFEACGGPTVPFASAQSTGDENSKSSSKPCC